jgi:hypothetical protein
MKKMQYTTKLGAAAPAPISVAAAPFYSAAAAVAVATEATAATPRAREKDPMTWGEPTWFLLHTMAEKIKPEVFAKTREDVLTVITTICTNLPCPECSEHAKKHLENIGFKNIRTKEELKTALFQFHNYVNSHKKFPIFSRDELDEKYARANSKNVIYHFMQHFQEGSKNPAMISQELFRTRILGQLVEWFKANLGLFE